LHRSWRGTPDELEREPRLGLDIDADNLETSPVVAHRRPAGAAEKVEQLHREISTILTPW
jgi:hypothetical protein